MKHPEKWIVVHLKNKEGEVHYRLFAEFYDIYREPYWGYNSGIVRVTEENGYLFFHGESGSKYMVHPDDYECTELLDSLVRKAARVVEVTIMHESEDWVNFPWK